MPRPLHHGRPSSAVIPTTWQQQIAPVVTNILTGSGCTVTITAPGSQPTWNEQRGQTETAANTPVYGPDIAPYAGAASITVVSDTDRQLEVADETPSTRRYELRLPWDAPPACDVIGNVVAVLTDPDPDLPGKHLIVQAVERDTRRFSRILYATLID